MVSDVLNSALCWKGGGSIIEVHEGGRMSTYAGPVRVPEFRVDVDGEGRVLSEDAEFFASQLEVLGWEVHVEGSSRGAGGGLFRGASERIGESLAGRILERSGLWCVMGVDSEGPGGVSVGWALMHREAS